MSMIYRTANTPYQLNERKVKLLQFDLGISNTDIARALNVSVATITRHIKNQRQNQFIQEGIARCLKTTLPQIAQQRRKAA